MALADSCPLEPDKPDLPVFIELDCFASDPPLEDGMLPFGTAPEVNGVCCCWPCGDVGADTVFDKACWDPPAAPVPGTVVPLLVPGGVVAPGADEEAAAVEFDWFAPVIDVLGSGAGTAAFFCAI